MTKSLIALFAIVLGASASASQLPNPILKLTTTNGTVAPQYRVTTECSAFANGELYILASGMTIRARPIVKQVAWTTAVPNAAAAAALVQAAKAGPFAPKIMPIGGGTSNYVGIETVGAGAPSPVTLESSALHNGSKAATILKTFLDYNCRQQ